MPEEQSFAVKPDSTEDGLRSRDGSVSHFHCRRSMVVVEQDIILLVTAFGNLHSLVNLQPAPFRDTFNPSSSLS